jgi:hypothetical protein
MAQAREVVPAQACRVVQKPRPPVFIPGGGSIETCDCCPENDRNYSYSAFTGIGGRRGR